MVEGCDGMGEVGCDEMGEVWVLLVRHSAFPLPLELPLPLEGGSVILNLPASAHLDLLQLDSPASAHLDLLQLDSTRSSAAGFEEVCPHPPASPSIDVEDLCIALHRRRPRHPSSH
ncbi:hypothetical protein ACLOJK_034329 [Asimina triloba]